MAKRKVHLIPINMVGDTDNPEPDRNKIARYRRALRRGDKLPPVDMVRKSLGGYSYYYVLDGSHRFHAHRLEGRYFIEAYLNCDRFPSPSALEPFPKTYATDFKGAA
jgi:uncharacterized ParB-like nuclease family protein